MGNSGRSSSLFRGRALVGAGVAMCVAALPLVVFAGTPSTPAISSLISWSCADLAGAANVDSYSASASANPLGIVSPTGGALASTVWTTPEIATTPGPLPPGTLGVSAADAGGVTGSATSPAPASALLAGYQSTSELDQFSPSSFPSGAEVTSDPNVAVANAANPQDILPSGAVTPIGSAQVTGSGVPYVAIFPLLNGGPDFSHPAASGVPAVIETQNYAPDPAAVAPPLLDPTCAPVAGGDHYAAIGVDLAPLLGTQLTPGTAYAAYLVVRDTDQHGPLGDHLWFFTATQPAGTGTLASHIRACAGGQQAPTEVPGGTVSAGAMSATDAGAGVQFTMAPASYAVSATAPAGYDFATCGSSGYSASPDGRTAAFAQTVAVAAGGVQEADFFVVPITGAPAAPPTGSLFAHFDKCVKGSPSHDQVSGGTVSVTDGTLTASKASPATFAKLAPGPVAVTATAPANYAFVHCPAVDSTYTVGVGGQTASLAQPLTVSAGKTVDVPFYLVPQKAASGPTFNVAVSVSPDKSVPINSELTYMVTVTNSGSAAGSPGVLSNALTATAGATCAVAIGATATAGTVTSPSGCPGTWTWDLSSVTLGPTGSGNNLATFTLGVEAQMAGTLADAATLSGSNCATATAAPCTVSTEIDNLQLTKTADPSSPQVPAASTITYTITLTNPAGTDTGTVLLTDAFGGDATVVVDHASFLAGPLVAGQVVCTSATGCTSFTWSWATIPSGTSATLKYTAVVSGGPSGSATVTNTVSTQGLTPARVSTFVVVTSGVQSARSTPTTGGLLPANLTLAAFLLCGGVSLVVLGAFSRKPRRA